MSMPCLRRKEDKREVKFTLPKHAKTELFVYLDIHIPKDKYNPLELKRTFSTLNLNGKDIRRCLSVRLVDDGMGPDRHGNIQARIVLDQPQVGFKCSDRIYAVIRNPNVVRVEFSTYEY
jgi:hypothetical protein